MKIGSRLRQICVAISPAFAGFLLSHSALIDIPFFIAGVLKIAYDLVLYRSSRRFGLPKKPIDLMPGLG